MSIKKPNLFIVGAPRCGTTSMYTYLKQHPDIFMSPTKETNYFGQDLTKLKRPASRKFDSLFSAWKDEKYAGEASVLHLYSRTAANELKAYNPSARIIILLRNPVDFLYSYHSQLLGIGYEDITDFEAALKAESERRQGKHLPRYTRKQGTDKLLYYHDVAAFSEQVQRYFDIFGRESVHVIILDDLKTNATQTYRDTLNFLGVSQDFKPEFKISNKEHTKIRFTALLPLLSIGSHIVARRNLLTRAFGKLVYWPLLRWNKQKITRKPMPDQLRTRLQTEFAPEVDKLSELLGRDLRYWSDTDIG